MTPTQAQIDDARARLPLAFRAAPRTRAFRAAGFAGFALLFTGCLIVPRGQG